MFPIYAVILGLSFLSILPQDASGTCELKTASPCPHVLINFGSKHILSTSPETYKREDGETIELFCATGFSITQSNSYYNSLVSDALTKTSLTMKCGHNNYFTYKNEAAPNLMVRCRTEVTQLFESNTSLPNCTDMTLVVGRSFGSMGLMKNAALCYDLGAAQLKYLGYTTFPETQIVGPTHLGQLNDIGLNILVNYQKTLFKTISQMELSEYLAGEKLFTEDTFQVGSLVQDEIAGRNLVGYEGLMTTIWLRALRLGNWKHWTTAMHAAVGVHFDVRLGVSGALEPPMVPGQSCNSTISFRIELADGRAVHIPTHIWAHLNAVEKTGTGQDEFVIIGHNSPFYRSNSSSLCPSMCNQVSWLRNSLFASLHEFPAYGMVQCCRVEDVAHKLDNFPGPFENVNPTTKTEVTPPTLEFLYPEVLGKETNVDMY